MTTAAPHSVSDHEIDPPSAIWQRLLLWAGVPACLLGLGLHRLDAQWHGGRFAELILLALTSLAIAVGLRKALRWPLANALAIVWLLALGFFVGVLPALAVVLVAATALAIGGRLVAQAPIALGVAGGLALLGGGLGWLLPVPMHYRAVYFAACAIVVIWQRRWLPDALRQAGTAWQQAVAAAPRVSAFAVVVLGLASTACWLPTMQADDVVYHLRLPWQLLEHHRYPLEPGLHIWSMAPWAADALQAIPQLLAAQEARGALNALWIMITAAGVWRMATLLAGTNRTAWWAVALYASLPLTAGLAGGMQTETPTAGLLVWLVTLVLEPGPRSARRLWLGAILFGGLLGLKLAAAGFALLLLPWALWMRGWPRPSALALAAAIALVVGGSSYVYAGIVAHNPFLPLFNGWFHSPYYAPANFDDVRWHAGFNAALPWQLTFNSKRYLEAWPGAGGFVLVALGGAWLLALGQRRTAATAVMVTALLAAALVPMQYLRYLFPALVLLLPVLAIASFRVEPRRAAWLLLGVCVLNLAFQANSFWLLRVGLLKLSIKEAGHDAPAFRAYLPERILIASIRNTSHGNVLALNPAAPYVAELGVQGRSTSAYDRPLQEAAQKADMRADGGDWAALLRHEKITDLLLYPNKLTSAQRAGLARVHASLQQREGDVEWWHVPAEASR